MIPGPNGCTCGFNGDCNCPFVSSDIENARQKRIRAAEHAEGERVVELAEHLVNELPADLEDGHKVTALLIAILAIVDSNGADRERVVDAAKAVAGRFPQIELEQG